MLWQKRNFTGKGTRGILADILVREVHRACAGRKLAAQCLEKRRLAAAIRPDQSGYLTTG